MEERRLHHTFFRNSVDLEEYFNSVSPKERKNSKSIRRSLNFKEWLQAKRHFDTLKPLSGQTLAIKEYFPYPENDVKRIFYLEKVDDGYCHSYMNVKADEKTNFTHSMY